MIEAVPRDPYGGYISDLLLVEKNMQLRRKRLHAVLRNNEIAPTSGNFPMLGVEGYGHTEGENGAVANSLYLSDSVINPHPRFGTLTRNIRQRRRGNVDIRIPKGVDNIGRLDCELRDDITKNCCDDNEEMDIHELVRRKQQSTNTGMEEAGEKGSDKMNNEKHSSDYSKNISTKGGVEDAEKDIDTIHMDAMAFGMGCCCLQVLCSTSLSYPVLYCSVLFCALLHCPVLYFTVLCSTSLFCLVLYCSVLFCTIPTLLSCNVLCCTVLCCSILFCTALYCTVLFSSELYFALFNCPVLKSTSE